MQCGQIGAAQGTGEGTQSEGGWRPPASRVLGCSCHLVFCHMFSTPKPSEVVAANREELLPLPLPFFDICISRGWTSAANTPGFQLGLCLSLAV